MRLQNWYGSANHLAYMSTSIQINDVQDKKDTKLHQREHILATPTSSNNARSVIAAYFIVVALIIIAFTKHLARLW